MGVKMIDKGVQQRDKSITGGPNERIGLLGWLSLYVSGGILFFLLLAHILAIHFSGGSEIDATRVRDDVSSVFLSLLSIGLLLVGIFHGFLGFRRMVLDLDLFGPTGDRWFKWILLVLGLGCAVFGLNVFRGFLIL